jgi:spermidine/putrescine transport system permease protein
MATLAARLRRWRRSEGAQGLLLVSPTLLYALLVLAAPLATIIAFSFWSQDYLTIELSFTQENYR